MKTVAKPNKSSGSCTVDDCDKPAIARMTICWAHYRRKKRGAKIDGPVRGYGTGQILVSGPHLAPQIIEMLERTAKKHPAPSGEPSKFDIQRRVVREWLSRLMNNKNPWLTAGKSLEDPVTSETGYTSVAKVPMTPDEKKYFDAAVEQMNMNSHALLIAVMDDWYYWWLEHDRAPKGVESVSPYE